MNGSRRRPRWLVAALAAAGAIAILLGGVTFAQAMSLRSSPGEEINMAPIVGAQSPVATISVTPSPTSTTAPSSPTNAPEPVQPPQPIPAPVPVDPVGPSNVDGDDDGDDSDDDDDWDDDWDDED